MENFEFETAFEKVLSKIPAQDFLVTPSQVMDMVSTMLRAVMSKDLARDTEEKLRALKAWETLFQRPHKPDDEFFRNFYLLSGMLAAATGDMIKANPDSRHLPVLENLKTALGEIYRMSHEKDCPHNLTKSPGTPPH